MSLHQGKAQCSLAVQAWHLLKCGRVEAEWDVTGAEISAAAGAVDDLLRMSSGIDWNEAASISSGGGNSPVNAAGEMLFEQADGGGVCGQPAAEQHTWEVLQLLHRQLPAAAVESQVLMLQPFRTGVICGLPICIDMHVHMVHGMPAGGGCIAWS